MFAGIEEVVTGAVSKILDVKVTVQRDGSGGK
jgi:hypothetical protein